MVKHTQIIRRGIAEVGGEGEGGAGDSIYQNFDKLSLTKTSSFPVSSPLHWLWSPSHPH